MREFSLLDILKYYVKYFWIVLIVTFIAELAGIIYINDIFIPVYKESATIILGKSNNTTEQEISGSTISLYDSLINNYLQLLESAKLLSNVKKDLNLNYKIKDLAEMIDYSVAGSSQIIQISVTNENDEIAAKICEQVVIELKEQVYDIYGIDNISIVDEPKANGKKIYNESLIIIAFTLSGFVLSSICLIIKFIFSDKVVYFKDEDQIMGIDVLGKIFVSSVLEKELNEYEEEGFRNIRLTFLANCDPSLKKIMVTSICPKTNANIIAYKLAMSLAKIGKKILLIDANEIEVKTELINQNVGLLDILNTNSCQSIVSKENNIDVVSLGSLEKIDLLSSNEFKTLVQTLEEEYDYIFITQLVIDNSFKVASILELTDGVILVNKINKTKISELEKLRKKMAKLNNKIVGLIVEKNKRVKCKRKKINNQVVVPKVNIEQNNESKHHSLKATKKKKSSLKSKKGKKKKK